MILLILGCLGSPSSRLGGDDGGEDGSTTGGEDGSTVDPIELVDPASLPQGDDPCREPILVKVTYVVDGDTAWVEGPDGDEDVRFIGVDTPEIAHSAGDSSDCYGDEAATFTRESLEGERVWLSFDAECLDYYDRTLAYIHQGTGQDDFYQRRLLHLGYAWTLAIKPNTSFEDTFDEDQAGAEGSGAGLWGACDY